MITTINSKTNSSLNLKEILSFKSLLQNLTKRDIKVRYKQTWLGMFWGILKPLMNIVVFGIISQFIDKSQGATQSFLNVSAGVLIWNLFSSATSEASSSLVVNAGLLTKVYFPKIIILINTLVVNLIDFSVALFLFFIFYLFIYGAPSLTILLIPIPVFLTIMLSLSLGLLFSTLYVKYRDVNFILPFILQFGFYSSPVFLKTSFFMNLNIPEILKKCFLLNPATSIIDFFRYCLFNQKIEYDLIYFFSSICIIFILFFVGLRYFLKNEKSFADFI